MGRGGRGGARVCSLNCGDCGCSYPVCPFACRARGGGVGLWSSYCFVLCGESTGSSSCIKSINVFADGRKAVCWSFSTPAEAARRLTNRFVCESLWLLARLKPGGGPILEPVCNEGAADCERNNPSIWLTFSEASSYDSFCVPPEALKGLSGNMNPGLRYVADMGSVFRREVSFAPSITAPKRLW